VVIYHLVDVPVVVLAGDEFKEVVDVLRCDASEIGFLFPYIPLIEREVVSLLDLFREEPIEVPFPVPRELFIEFGIQRLQFGHPMVVPWVLGFGCQIDSRIGEWLRWSEIE